MSKSIIVFAVFVDHPQFTGRVFLYLKGLRLFADIAVPDYYKAEIRVPVKVQQYLADCRAQIESRLHRDQNSVR